MDIEHVRSRFIKHFDGTTGFIYASPGRINLIGEHTDYNGETFRSPAKSPDPPALQKIQPVFPSVPSRFGQVIPPSSAIL